VIPITIGNATSLTTIQGNCSISNELSTPGGIKSTGNITTSGTATITAISTGYLIGPYKNAATSSASITTAGQITGTSLVLASGAIGCGAITSTGNISTSSASGTITAPAGGFLIGPYKNAATATASITAAGVITGASLGLGTGAITASTIDTSTNATTLKLGSNITTANVEIGGALTTGDIYLGNAMQSGGVVYVGSSSSTMQNNGTLKTLLGTYCGNTPYLFYNTATNYTIPSTINQSFLMVISLPSNSITITLPAVLVNQEIILRNINTAAHTISVPSGAGAILFPIGTNVVASSISLPTTGVVRLLCGGTNPYYWFQV